MIYRIYDEEEDARVRFEEYCEDFDEIIVINEVETSGTQNIDKAIELLDELGLTSYVRDIC